jgi:thermitase
MQTRNPRSKTLAGPFILALALSLALALAATTWPAAHAGSAPTPQVSPAFRDVVPGRVLVGYRDGVGAREAAAIERRVGAQLVGRVPRIGVRVLEVPSERTAEVLRALGRQPGVRFAEPEAVVQAMDVTPNDEWWPSQWSPVRTRAPLAWETTTGSSATVVAVLDTGVDLAQPDLQGAFVPGRDVVNGDADPTDDHGHGTYVTGIVAARSNNTIGVASYCWRCSIMPVKVLDARGSGTTSSVAAGIVWATDHGARVITMSLGSQSASSTLASAVRYARDRGVVLVAAAGNYGTSTPVYPAAYPEVIGVAASNARDQLSTWSSFGSWVSVAAPGSNYTTGRGGWYGSFAGTSSAAPVVAGIAGLALSHHPAASPSEIEQAIAAGAVPIGEGVQHGRVDALGTLQALPVPGTTSGTDLSQASPSPSPPDVATVTYSGSLSRQRTSRTYELATGEGPLSASLAFTRSSSLELQVLAPDGTVLASPSGASPLGLAVSVSSGTYRFVVSGASRASFTLTIAYPPP